MVDLVVVVAVVIAEAGVAVAVNTEVCSRARASSSFVKDYLEDRIGAWRKDA